MGSFSFAKAWMYTKSSYNWLLEVDPTASTAQPKQPCGSALNSNVLQLELEQLERLRSEDTPRRLMITHTIGSQVKKIINLELKTLQSRHDFQSQGQMTLKI